MNLIDENDNVPSFTKRIYYIDIPEDHPVDTDMSKPVGKVTAVDADAGNNAAIKYSIIGGNKASVFNINPETGDIYLQQSLDREVQVIARRESVKQFILLECYFLEIQCMCLKRDIAVKIDEKCVLTRNKKNHITCTCCYFRIHTSWSYALKTWAALQTRTRRKWLSTFKTLTTTAQGSLVPTTTRA